MMRRLALWMAKRYLRVTHYRFVGSANFLELAPGDLLITPGAMRFMDSIDDAHKFGQFYDYALRQVVQGPIYGCNLPVIQKK